MKLHATGSTTSAELVLCWPQALPVDLDARLLDPTAEPEEIVEELRNAGHLLFIPAHARGDHHLLLLLDEPIPAQLDAYCNLVTKCDALKIAGGGRFVGVELLFDQRGLLLNQQATPGIDSPLPAGEYFAELFTTDIPAEVYETWIRDQAGSTAQRWWWLQTWIASAGVVAFLIFVLCLFLAPRQSVYVTFGGSSFLLFIAWLMSRTESYRRVQRARQDYHEAYPEIVVRLRQVA